MAATNTGIDFSSERIEPSLNEGAREKMKGNLEGNISVTMADVLPDDLEALNSHSD